MRKTRLMRLLFIIPLLPSLAACSAYSREVELSQPKVVNPLKPITRAEASSWLYRYQRLAKSIWPSSMILDRSYEFDINGDVTASGDLEPGDGKGFGQERILF